MAAKAELAVPPWIVILPINVVLGSDIWISEKAS